MEVMHELNSQKFSLDFAMIEIGCRVSLEPTIVLVFVCASAEMILARTAVKHVGPVDRQFSSNGF